MFDRFLSKILALLSTAGFLGFLYTRCMVPFYPNLILDTSREASVRVRHEDIPFAVASEPGSSRALVNAFETDSIIVRALSRLSGGIISEFVVVADAHRLSDREAMEEAAERLRELIAEYKGSTPGEVLFT